MRLDIIISVLTNILQSQIRHTPDKRYDFLFKFLRINLGKGPSYHDLYRDIEASVNNLRLMVELREKRFIRLPLIILFERGRRLKGIIIINIKRRNEL